MTRGNCNGILSLVMAHKEPVRISAHLHRVPKRFVSEKQGIGGEEKLSLYFSSASEVHLSMCRRLHGCVRDAVSSCTGCT